MNNKLRLFFRPGIRARLLGFLLAMVLITVALVAYLAINSLQTSGERAMQTGEASLRAQAEESLLTQIVQAANQDNLLFEKIQKDAKNLADFTAGLYDHPQAFTRDSYWLAEKHMSTGPQGQYVNGASDITTVFVPNFVEIDGSLIQELELSAYLDMLFPSVFDDDANIAAVYLITQSEISRLYPNISLGSIVPSDYSAVQDIFFSIGAPENNPDRNVVWTPPYDDPAGQGLLVSAIAPVYTSGGRFVGIIGIDVSLAGLTASIEAERLVAGGYSFIVDPDGRALALPGQGYVDVLGRARLGDEFGPDLNQAVPTFLPVLEKAVTGGTRFESIIVRDREMFVVYAPMTATGWARVSVFDAKKMLAAVGTLQTELENSTRSLIIGQILPAGAVIALIVALLGVWFTSRLADPIQKLADGAKRIGAGDWDTPLPKGGPDEIGSLADAIREMAAQIRDSVQGLEHKVADRTKALATSTEVSRRLSTVVNRRALFVEVVQQVKDSFGYYHAHIYMYDDKKDVLVMAGGTGEAGAAMLAQGHRLPKGRGLVGRAGESNQPVLVPDTSQDPAWLPNPLLPDTKSEVAIPISVGDEVLGVLDVQHNMTNGLGLEDVDALQAIANQVAVALQNIEATETVVKRAAELQTVAAITSITSTIQNADEMLNAVVHLTQRQFGLYHAHVFTFNENSGNLEIVACGWKQGDEHEGTHGTTAIPLAQEQSLVARAGRTRQAVIVNDVHSEPGWLPNPLLPDTASELAVPLIVGDRLLGVLDVQSDRLNAFTQEDANIQTTLASAVASALQNARSVEQTRRQAEREMTINLITQKIQNAPTIETALKVAARELGHALGMKPTLVFLEPEAADGAQDQRSIADDSEMMRRGAEK